MTVEIITTKEPDETFKNWKPPAKDMNIIEQMYTDISVFLNDETLMYKVVNNAFYKMALSDILDTDYMEIIVKGETYIIDERGRPPFIDVKHMLFNEFKENDPELNPDIEYCEDINIKDVVFDTTS